MQARPQRQTSARARVSAGDCGCGSTAASTGARRAGGGFSFGVLERPRYYARQLMTPDDLLLEADYFRDRLRRHNMFLHGWGVVCGALVCVVPRKQTATNQNPKYQPHSSTLRNASDIQRGASEQGTGNGNGNGNELRYEPWQVQVSPGYILGPYGDEIVIERPVTVDLRSSGVSGCGADSGDDLADPWCSEVFVDRRTDPFYIAIRYRECPVRPVRGQPVGCGCDDEPCEYSRFRDGFQIGFLDCCPDDQDKKLAPDEDDWEAVYEPFCPECPTSPWVVLAEVTVDQNGAVTPINNCACRRVMVTTRDWWTTCSGTNCDQPRDYQRIPAGEQANHILNRSRESIEGDTPHEADEIAAELAGERETASETGESQPPPAASDAAPEAAPERPKPTRAGQKRR